MKKIVSISAVVLLLAACSLVSAQQWQQVNSPGTGRFAVDPQGTLWLTTGQTLSRWAGNGWEAETIPGAPSVQNASLTFSADGRPHIACVSGDNVWYLTKGPSGWSKPEFITNDAYSYAANSNIVVDSSGKPYIAWSQNNNQYIYMSSRNSDGTWSKHYVDVWNKNAGWWPDVKIDPSGKFYVVYTVGYNDTCKVAISRPDSNWDYKGVNPYGRGWLPQIEISADGLKRYAYADYRTGYYMLSYEEPGGTMTTVAMPNGYVGTQYINYSLTLMGDGSPLMVYTSGSSSKIYCSLFKSGRNPITFTVGDAVYPVPDNFWNAPTMDAQVVGSTLFVNYAGSTFWTTVPEPSSIMALLAGVAGLGLIRRRK